ncbi:cell division cycle- protein, partial [Nowakowskiella sp. JEL0078]
SWPRTKFIDKIPQDITSFSMSSYGKPLADQQPVFNFIGNPKSNEPTKKPTASARISRIFHRNSSAMPRLQSTSCANNNESPTNNILAIPFESSPMNLCSANDLKPSPGYSNTSRWEKKSPILGGVPLSKNTKSSKLPDHIFLFPSSKCNSSTSMVEKHETTSPNIPQSQTKSAIMRRGVLKHTISSMEIDDDYLETDVVTDCRSIRRKPSSILSVKSPVFDFDEPAPRKPPAKMRRTVSDFALKKIPQGGLDATIKRHSIAAPLRSLSTSGTDTQYLLPCMDTGKDAIKRIEGETLSNLLNGVYNDKINEYHIIDCRFPYEYNGGHISTSKNVTTMRELEDLFFSPPSTNTNVVLIFTCEFSSQRGPRMALHIRDVDRKLNYDNYPALFYPNLY